MEQKLLNMDKLTWPRDANAVAARTTSLTLNDMTRNYYGKKGWSKEEGGKSNERREKEGCLSIQPPGL